MKFYFQNENLTLEEVITGNFNKNILSNFEQQVFNFVKKWHSENRFFDFVTSGSTGASKEIKLSRDQMIYSAKTSMDFLDTKAQLKSSILCIYPHFIGGAMLIVRSMINRLDMYLVEPGSPPKIDNLPASLVSLVPMQVIKILEHSPASLKSIETLLIGGAGLPEKHIDQLKTKGIKSYLTYGMTETASHIALRDLQSDNQLYQVIGDAQLDIDERSCLKVKGTITAQQWILTNDVVRLKSAGTFQLIGRADLIINTGGFKVNPETIESTLQPSFESPVLIVSIKDEYWGQKIVLLIEHPQPMEINHSVFDQLHPYARPKEIHFISSFCYTQNGKIDRFATAKLIPHGS